MKTRTVIVRRAREATPTLTPMATVGRPEGVDDGSMLVSGCTVVIAGGNLLVVEGNIVSAGGNAVVADGNLVAV